MTSPTAPIPAADDPERIDPAVWRTAFTLIVGVLAIVFDTTIVSVALQTLGGELHASLSTIQWVSTGYLLAMFVTIPMAGWAQSVFGGKRLWIGALGLFLGGSMLCATAWNAPSLIVFRIVQGVGGGVMLPLMTTLIMQATGGRNIGRVMATITLPVSLGPIFGPVIGGVILHVADWRWLFLVNVPFCLTGAWLAWRNLTPDRPKGRRAPLDVVGMSLLCPGVAAIVYGLSQVEGSAGISSVRVLLPLVGGAVLVAAFGFWAVPRASRALVDLRLFHHRPVASASTLGFLSGGAIYGVMLLMPLYWQRLRGEDALGAGLVLIPQGIGALLSRNIAGRCTDRFGPRWVAFVGFSVVSLGTIPFALADQNTPRAVLMGSLLIRGLGLGAATIPLTGAAYTGLARDEIPHASIIVRVSQQIGGSLGTAVLAVVLQHTAAGARTPSALARGFDGAFWWAVVFTAVAVPLTLLLPGRPTRSVAARPVAPVSSTPSDQADAPQRT